MPSPTRSIPRIYYYWENMKINEFDILLTTEIRRHFYILALTMYCVCDSCTPKSLVVENKVCDNHASKQNMACVRVLVQSHIMAVAEINLAKIFFQREKVSYIFSTRAFFSEKKYFILNCLNNLLFFEQ